MKEREGKRKPLVNGQPFCSQSAIAHAIGSWAAWRPLTPIQGKPRQLPTQNPLLCQTPPVALFPSGALDSPRGLGHFRGPARCRLLLATVGKEVGVVLKEI
eukprot:1156828-Pelagomonas_calceolata.AAC.1